MSAPTSGREKRRSPRSGKAAATRRPADPDSEPITEQEAEDIEERSSPRTPVIYEVVRRYGEAEMARPVVSLWWSGVAAGLSISFSLLAQAVLVMHLPDSDWSPLVSSAGYSVGFLMVILARQQLFTENTITVVLPVMNEPTVQNLGRLGRMWTVVFLANLCGTLLAALFCALTPVLTADLLAAMRAVSAASVDQPWPHLFFGGITAGFLIATMVWLAPSAGSAQFLVITVLTWLIAVGGFPHIVAGSVESFLLVVSGDLGVGQMLVGYTVPVLLGNIVGGTVLFAVLSYAQVMNEI